MFFSTELLSRRDSGYALLWLAATVGSKMKKLPRRDVLSADIIELCKLVSTPPEPLALRLSSNLMVGVVRVYKMKHEIFESDVGNCVTFLKKHLNELRNAERHDINLVHGHIRGDNLNLVADPTVSLMLELEATLEDWDTVFRRAEEESLRDEDYEFNLSFAGDSSASRKKLHQLDESHDHFFSSSFLNSFSQGDSGADPSSSINVPDPVHDFEFGDVGTGLGEEMERDLAEAWNIKLDSDPLVPRRERHASRRNSRLPRERDIVPPPAENGEIDFLNDQDVDMGFQFVPESQDQGEIAMDFNFNDPGDQGEIPTDFHFNDQFDPTGNDITERSMRPQERSPPYSPLNPPREVSILSQVPLQGILRAPTDFAAHKAEGTIKKKGKKRVRLVDPRLELTDEELKFQRYNYPEEMARLRRQAEKKTLQKEGKLRFEADLWTPPSFFAAPELVELWNIQVVYPVKAREAAWRTELEETEEVDEEPPRKKVKINKNTLGNAERNNLVLGMDVGFEVNDRDMDRNMDVQFEDMAPWDMGDGLILDDLNSGDRRSSDDPGQARHASRPPSLPNSSLLGRLDFDRSEDEPISQNFFPWDNAASSSSMAPIPGSVSRLDLGLSFDSTTVRIRRPSSKSESLRESPALSLPGQMDMGMDFGDDFMMPEETTEEHKGTAGLQETDNMVTLERNSFNFLGYAKMHQASNASTLFFSDIVPVGSSSTRVAAEGFYHCLALATKDLIRVEQNEPFGQIKIEMK